MNTTWLFVISVSTFIIVGWFALLAWYMFTPHVWIYNVADNQSQARDSVSIR